MFGPRPVLGRPFDILDIFAGIGDGLGDRLQNRLRLHLQFIFHVEGGGGDEGVDALVFGGFDRLHRRINILFQCAAQPGNGGCFGLFGDGVDRFPIPAGGNGKPGLDHINAERFQQGGHFDLLLHIHGASGRLLTIAQGGVKDDYTVRVLFDLFQKTHNAYSLFIVGDGW